NNILLDGDEIRTGHNRDLGFSIEDRKENIRRVAEINNILLNNNIFTINAFITPTEEIRNLARDIIVNRLFKIFLSTPLDICRERDPKGFYKKAKAGEISQFTGVDAVFEIPTYSKLSLD